MSQQGLLLPIDSSKGKHASARTIPSASLASKMKDYFKQAIYKQKDRLKVYFRTEMQYINKDHLPS